MAPRRGGGGGGSDGDSGMEQTMILSKYPWSTAGVIINAIFMGFFFLFFIWSLVNNSRWSKTPECRFLAMMVWASLFWFVSYGLGFASNLADAMRATVFESWVLLPSWEATFSLLGELLLIAVIYYILHNRLRAVAIPKKTVSKIAFIHWSFLVIMVILALILLAGSWANRATYLHDLKTPLYLGDHVREDYLRSRFYRIHLRRVDAAFSVLRFLIQLEMVAIGGLVLTKSKNNPGGRTTTRLFLFGSLVTYIIAPLTLVVITFEYWNAYVELWLPPVQWGLVGAAQSVCVLFICIFASMLDRQQWELGISRRLQTTEPVVAVYKYGETYHHYTPPQAQGYYAHPPGQSQ